MYIYLYHSVHLATLCSSPNRHALTCISGVATRVGSISTTARNRSASRASPLGDFSPSTPSASTAGSAVSSIGNNRCFTFLLANNTSTQFGVCLQLPRSFRDLSKGVIVSFDYYVCVITKLPFLSYIFNLLMQLDALGGLDFSEPVQRLLPSSLLQPSALRLLMEFTRHLRGVRVPIYRLGPRYFSGDTDYDDDEEAQGNDTKSTYQSVSFNMAMRSTIPGGSFSQLLDTISISPLPIQSSSRYVSASPVTRGKSLVKRSLTGVFRRDLIGSYSALPFTPQPQHKNSIPPVIPDPPFLPSPKWPIDDNLLGQLEEDREKEVCFHTLLWALPALLRHLPLDQIILAIGCALTEMRVVVVGDDLGVVSGCVLALVNLLRPLRWAGPVIVTLPSSLHAYLESPVPLILGMQTLPEGFKLASGIIMIDPKVIYHSDYD
jgi:DENN (AEX-3) domain